MLRVITIISWVLILNSLDMRSTHGSNGKVLLPEFDYGERGALWLGDFIISDCHLYCCLHFYSFFGCWAMWNKYERRHWWKLTCCHSIRLAYLRLFRIRSCFYRLRYCWYISEDQKEHMFDNRSIHAYRGFSDYRLGFGLWDDDRFIRSTIRISC